MVEGHCWYCCPWVSSLQVVLIRVAPFHSIPGRARALMNVQYPYPPGSGWVFWNGPPVSLPHLSTTLLPNLTPTCRSSSGCFLISSEPTCEPLGTRVPNPSRSPGRSLLGLHCGRNLGAECFGATPSGRTMHSATGIPC